MISNITINSKKDELVIIAVPVSIRFWLILIVTIPSLFLTLFLLYHLIFDRNLRSSLHNHVTIILLICTLIYETIDIPLNLIYFQTGRVWPMHPATCLIMWMIEFDLFYTCEILVAWASFERHILIFHYRLINTQIKRLLFHYLPIIGILAYTTIFYVRVILFADCENQFYYGFALCGGFPCYQANRFLAMWDIFAHSVVPTLLIGVFSLALFLRVVIQKRALGRQVEWRRYRKMFIQLILLSSLHFSINFPLMFITFVYVVWQSIWVIQIQFVFFFIVSFLLLLQPFVLLSSLPDARQKFRKLIPKLKRRIVVPQTNQNDVNSPVT